MSAGPVHQQAVLGYVFARADGPDAPAGWTHLQALWQACRQQLQMDAAIPGLTSATLPGSGADGPAQPGLIAACQRPDGRGVWQAFLRRDHDVTCLALLMAPDPLDTTDDPEADTGGWEALQRLWDTLGPPSAPPGLLGQALLLLGLAPPDTPAAPAAGLVELSGLVRSTVAGPARPRWWQQPATTRHPFTLWDASASDRDDRAARRIVALATPAGEDDLYRWVWTSGDGELAPFARYLVHAAKLRHQLRVFDDGRAFRHIHTAVDTAVDDLLRLHLSPNPATIALTQLLHARTRLAAVQTGTAGLIAVSTRLREISRTVAIAQTNMTALATHADGPDPPTGLFADDHTLAAWFTDRLADEQVYLDAARDRARDIADLTAAVVGQRLADHHDTTRRHQNRMTLLQTSILGALLMALAAIQALGYQLRVVPGTAKAPLIVLLATLALALPFWALRLNPKARDGAPLGITDHIMIGAVGAAAGWLTTAWATSGHHHPPAWTILAALGGAILTVTITRLITLIPHRTHPTSTQ